VADERSSTQVMLVPTIKDEGDGDGVLVVLYGPNLGRRYPLGPDEVILGRGADVHIVLDADSVSRRHARVKLAAESGAGFVLEDLGSTNGSYVNDRRVERALLKDGDIIRIGVTILKFLSGSNIEAAYHEEIYRLTILDALTSVHNKRFFLEFLEREISRSQRHATTLALVLFDVDHFKQVNDTHGHMAGDTVLKEICRRLRPRIRREDLLARYGGEEFACVLPDTTRSGAGIFAEALRILVERDPVIYQGTRIPVTISLGVAVHSVDEPASTNDLIRRADEKLYQAKRAGRNKVVV
jgi:two-component system, cell cycle response regulator